MRTTAFALLLLLSCSASFAATPRAVTGGSGIAMMRTAEVMPDGESSWFFSGTMTTYPAVTTGDSLLIDRTLGYATAGWENSEFEVSVSHGTFSADPASANDNGLRGWSAVYKQAFTDPVPPGQDGTSVALSVHSRFFAGQSADRASSEKETGGLELNVSRFAAGSAFHFNTGYAYDEVWQGTAADPFTNDHVLTFEFGVEKALSRDMTLAVQSLTALRNDSPDESTAMSIALGYTPGRSVAVTLGALWGFPDERAAPKSAVLLNFTWSGDSGRPHTLVQAAAGPSNADILANDERLSGQLDRIDGQLGGLGRQLAEHDEYARANLSPEREEAPSGRIELVDASGVKGLGDRVAAALRKRGYDVGAVHPGTAGPRSQTSQILYATGHSDQAIRLGKDLPGDQLVYNRPLPRGVWARVIIGRDLRQFD